MSVYSETFCGAPGCDKKVFGTFCEEHAKLVEEAQDSWVQLGIVLREARERERLLTAEKVKE